MPWFKSGVHDRVYSAMLNECVCLTDGSEYLDRTLADGREALFYSLDHLNELPDKVKRYLKEPEELKQIAQRGWNYAKDAQTWQNRARQMAKIMESSRG